jgi:hypothetical protein
MTFLPTGEKPMTFADVAARLPAARTGRPTDPNVVRRWMSRGIVGPAGSRVRLETWRIGGKIVTTLEAVARFFAAIQRPTPPDARSTATQSSNGASALEVTCAP